MRLTAFLFALLLGMCLILGYVLLLDEIPDGHGYNHPDYPTMQRGGDGATRHAQTLWIGWALGVLELLFFVGLLALGSRRRKQYPFERNVLIVGTLVYIAFFTWMVIAYTGYAADPSAALVLSFPLPTTLMLYGVGFAPVVFIVLYMIRFSPWIVDDDELDTFLRRVREMQDE
jgi:MFS superfamily sulfate permease-like transporter